MPRFFLSPIKSAQVKNIQKRLKKQGYYKDVIYMFNSGSIETLQRHLQPRDTLVIFGEGIPWAITGNDFDSDSTKSSFALAEFIAEIVKDKSIELTIELRACNSATKATGEKGEICYAKDFSRALQQLGFENITVKGYTGYIQVENPFKPSVVEWYGNSGSKMGHCRYEEAQAQYKNGILTTPPQKVIVKDYTYSNKDLESLSLKNYFNDKERIFPAKVLPKKPSQNSIMDIQFPLLFSELSLSPPFSKERKEKKDQVIPRGNSPRKSKLRQSSG